jgi:4-amino-4-deoxy-L-arabinose transferase-like glycosyltransferase
MRLLRAHGWLLAILVVASFVMLWRLDVRPYENWDEAIHGEVAFEMLESGAWLTPQYTNAPYFRKPPLRFWIGRALFERFGVNAWTLRLPNAVAGILVALLCAWWMREWRRSRFGGFLAGFMVSTMPAVHYHAFRTGEMDGLLTLFVVATLYSWWKWTRAIAESSSTEPKTSFRWLIASGAAIGLAVMTKSAAGLIPLPIMLAHAVAIGAWRRIRFREVLAFAGACFIVTLPWHLAMTFTHGTAFWDSYLGWHVLRRITESLHNEGAGPWYYGPMFWNRFAPYSWWSIPAFIFAIAALRRSDAKQRDDVRHTISLLLIWCFVIFSGFTLAKTKFDWYLLPLYPAASLLVAWCITESITRAHTSMRRLGISILVAITLVAGARTAIRHLIPVHPPSPSLPVAQFLALREGGLVAFGFPWRQHPAAYFTVHTIAPQIRLSDGLDDPERVIERLSLREPSWIITQKNTELPEELRSITQTAQPMGDYEIWSLR